MTTRRPFEQTVPLTDRLAEEAKRLRDRAEGMEICPERDHLLRKARQTEMVANVTEWINSPGLLPPT